MWSIPKDKVPGLNGFNSGFYKATWEIVGTYVVKAVQDFLPMALSENLGIQQLLPSFQRLPPQTPQVTIVQSLVAMLSISVSLSSYARNSNMYWVPL